ncbi:MAG: hypothetical protein ACRD3G_09265 [Vicinamibacterales bacterium]
MGVVIHIADYYIPLPFRMPVLLVRVAVAVYAIVKLARVAVAAIGGSN